MRELLSDENELADREAALLGRSVRALLSEFDDQAAEDASGNSTPVRRGAWWYFSRRSAGRFPMQCRVPIAHVDEWQPPTVAEGETLSGEQLLLDANVELAESPDSMVGSLDVSADGMRLLYTVARLGEHVGELRVKELGDTGAPDSVLRLSVGSAVFGADSAQIFYVTIDALGRPNAAFAFRVGGELAGAWLLFQEDDPRLWLRVSLTRSQRFLVISSIGKRTSEVRLLDLSAPALRPRLVRPREEGLRYAVEHAVLHDDDHILVLRSREMTSCLVTVPFGSVEDPSTEIVLMEDDEMTQLVAVNAFENFLVIAYRRAGLARAGVITRGAVEDHLLLGTSSARRSFGLQSMTEIPTNGDLATVALDSNREWHARSIRAVFSSFAFPWRVATYDVKSHSQVTLKQQREPNGFSRAEYVETREWATADDGTQIPISLVQRKDIRPLREPLPMLLHVYGAYGVATDATFSPHRLSLLDRGVVVGIAHVRGGGELGTTWHARGRGAMKPNTFEDLKSCIDHLVRNRWTSSDRLVVQGSSAGGLVVGVAANQYPDRMAGIVAQDAFVDPMATLLDPTVPLTATERDEWGDPAADDEARRLISSYSPTDNVRRQHYPQILVTAGLRDTRVSPSESLAWVTRLRAAGANVLLRTEMNAGHGGEFGESSQRDGQAFTYAWILRVLGVDVNPNKDGS